MISFGAVVDEIRRLAGEFPGRKAESVLLDGRIPVCIVGHALVNLGVELEMRPQLDEWDEPMSEDNALLYRDGVRVGKADDAVDGMDWNALGFVEPTEDQLGWAYKVQRLQDIGYAWDLAVHEADVDVKVSA
jgi:hypothetical protein